MAFTTPNLSLSVWNLLADAYDHTQLAANWVAIDQHDHGANGGVPVSTQGIADGSITTAKIANGAVTTPKIADGAVTLLKLSADQFVASSSLPSSPIDGQICYFVVDATNGIIWQFRYRTASASAFKWEFIGGPPLYAQITTEEFTLSNLYVALTTVGPSITVPLAGDYFIETGAFVRGPGGGVKLGLMSYSIGASTATDNDAVVHISDQEPSATMRVQPKNGLSANTALVAKYRTDDPSGTNFSNRFLSAVPVRVG